MQRLHVGRRLGALSWRRKRLGRSLQQLRLPLRDLIGVNVVALRELGHRQLPSDRLKGHFRFEDRAKFSITVLWAGTNTLGPGCWLDAVTATEQSVSVRP